jgi:hypothetical protein
VIVSQAFGVPAVVCPMVNVVHLMSGPLDKYERCDMLSRSWSNERHCQAWT